MKKEDKKIKAMYEFWFTILNSRIKKRNSWTEKLHRFLRPDCVVCKAEEKLIEDLK